MELNEFRCRMCGACCRIKDGIVRVSDAEIARIAAFLGMDETEFIERETEVAPDRKSLILKSRPDGPFEWSNPDSAEVCPALAKAKTRREISK